jgi:hypothetical protein
VEENVMARKVGDLMVPNGKYIKEGEEKTSWLKCGVMLETDKGTRIKLDCVPTAADWDGWMSVFADKDDGFRDAGSGGGEQGAF